MSKVFCFLVFAATYYVLTQAATPGVPCWGDTCEFTLTLTLGHSMTQNNPGGGVDNLELFPNGCLKPEEAGGSGPCLDIRANEAGSNVVSGDGRRRRVLLVNGQFPGPTLEVMEGATVIVHVQNRMANIGTSIHWHGMFQRGTPWMDGASYFTQCPIQPGFTFTYRFTAAPAGTMWYHPHIANQRSDGHYGFLIVHKVRPSLPELPLFVADWNLIGGMGERITNIRIGSVAEIPDPVSSLINGRGRHEDTPDAPLSRYQVQAGQKYRFRCVNGASDTGYAISVDGHTLTVVAWDGTELDPIMTNILNIFPGERVDFEITISSSSNAYWIRAVALPMEDSNPLDTYAVMHTSALSGDPVSQPTACTSSNKCKVFNCFRPFATSDNKICIDLKQIKTTSSAQVSKYLQTPSREIFYNVAVSTGDGLNGRRFVNPLSPFYQDYPQGLISCQPVCTSTTEACWCTNNQRLDYNEVVTLVISNLESESDAHDGSVGHPMHLHGHHFVVIAHGFGVYNSITGDMVSDSTAITCEPGLCRSPRFSPGYPIESLHLDRPPLKDTVIVPPGGYVVLRFVTDNPGYWLLHCHFLRDQIDGMDISFEIAPGTLNPPPQQIPPCSPYYEEKGPEPKPTPPDRIGDKFMDRTIGLAPLELLGIVSGAFAFGIFLIILCLLAKKCCVRSRKDKVSPVY